MVPIDYLLLGAGLIAGLLVGVYVIGQKRFDEGELQARTAKIIDDAGKEGSRLRAEAQKKALSIHEQFETEKNEFSVQLEKMEKSLEAKTATFKKREAKIIELQNALKAEEESVHSYRQEISRIDVQAKAKLFSLTGFAEADVQSKVIEEYESNLLADRELRIQRQFEWDTESAIRTGRNVLAEVMRRFTDGTSVEHARGEINVPRDEIKGRIVGRGGRLIAFFEEKLGVDVIFNDEPNTIIVSCFNLVQQEIARRALERLMKERIISEETILKNKTLAEQEVDTMLRTEGERALKLLGLQNMPVDFAKLIGRLKFRTSYGQNIMRHCFEVGYFARLLANEIGADPQVAFLGGFFHDIGKAIDQEVGGSHDVLSKEILEKYGFSWEITHAAWTHHNAIPQETVEARLVQAADAISAGRPGARAESVERYLSKIKDLQETAFSFAGVKKAYAINAGRELRVIVEPDKVNDVNIPLLAGQIAAKVQEKGGYPGKIKIVTVRSTKATDYAR